ncbi:MAG: hypothetical protein ACREJC_15325, partial [Tepidisphaeraceae bacterium]
QMVGPIGEINRTRAGYVVLDPEGLHTAKGEVRIGRTGLSIAIPIGATDPNRELTFVHPTDEDELAARLGGYQITIIGDVYDILTASANLHRLTGAPVQVAGELQFTAAGKSGSTERWNEFRLTANAKSEADGEQHDIFLIASNLSIGAAPSGTAFKIFITAADQYTVGVNPLTGDIDFEVDGDTIADVLKVDAGLDAVLFNNYTRFKEITAPPTPASANVNVYAKSDGKLYSKDDAGVETLMSGGSGGGASEFESILDVSRTETLISNTATETDIYSITVPANTLGTTKAIQMDVTALMLNNTGGNITLQFRIYFGTSSLTSVVDTVGTSTAWRECRMRYVLRADGATNDQRAYFQTPFEVTDAIVGDFAIDSTVGRTMKITVDFDTASANCQLLAFVKFAAVLVDV